MTNNNVCLHSRKYFSWSISLGVVIRVFDRIFENRKIDQKVHINVTPTFIVKHSTIGILCTYKYTCIIVSNGRSLKSLVFVFGQPLNSQKSSFDLWLYLICVVELDLAYDEKNDHDPVQDILENIFMIVHITTKQKNTDTYEMVHKYHPIPTKNRLLLLTYAISMIFINHNCSYYAIFKIISKQFYCLRWFDLFKIINSIPRNICLGKVIFRV